MFQPTEYEQMLIAAGWIEAGDCDPEFIEFQQKTPIEKEYADYDGFMYLRGELEQLNAAYEAEIAPLYAAGGSLDWQQRERESELLRRMDRVEANLGY